MKHRFYVLLLGVAALTAAPAWAQVGTIEGRVIDAQAGIGVPGVNVTLEGTDVGTATDLNGAFQFTATAGTYTLVASFVGYERYTQPVTVRPDETTTVEIELAEDLVALDELVVTALGIEREERSIGYAVQEVEGARLANAGTSNVVNALQGQTAGVQITSSSGQPGKAARIVIRGNASLLGENQPLFVIDGIPVSNDEDDNPGGPSVFTGGTTNRGVDIDPNIIESVSVLKGASATALYGSRASNGAVIITTKGAAFGQQRPRVNVTSRLRWDDPVIDGYQDEYLQGQNGFFQNGIVDGFGAYIEPGAVDIDGDPLTVATTSLNWGPHKDELSPEVLADLAELDTEYPELNMLGANGQLRTFDPRDQYFQTGLVAENSVNLSGGGSGVNYFFAVSDLRQEGIVPGSDLSRTSFLAKFGATFAEKLTTQTSVNFIRTDNNYLLEGNGGRAYMFTMLRAPISFDLRPTTYPDGSQRVFTNSASANNPFWLSDNQSYVSGVNRLIASTNLSYKILPWLSLNERIGVDTYNDTRKEEINVGTRSRPDGSMFDQKITRTQVNSDLTLQVDRDLTEDISLSATVGNNVNLRFFEFNFLRGENLGVPGFYNIENAAAVTGDQEQEKRLLLSAFGQATLDYRDYLFLTLTGRNDWSSTLPEDNNSYFYPSASLGFVFTDALGSVFERTPLSFGKVRTSVAQIGSDAPVYSLATTYAQATTGDGQRGNINFPFNGINGYEISNELGNPDLKPEISTEYEVGLDLRFFGQRLRFDGAYYSRTTQDQIFDVPISSTTGYRERLTNAGEVKNFGYEFTFGATPIETPEFQWDVGFNFSKNTTEVIELADGVENIFLFGFTSPQIRLQPGEDGYGVIWGPRFERNEGGELLIGDDGLPIWDTSGDGVIGNVMPDWLANARTTLSYKGLSLSAVFDIREGGDILNFDQFYSVFWGTAELTENRGTPIVWDGIVKSTGEPNTTEVMQDQDYYQNFYSRFASTELFVEDGSYVKLKEVSLAWSLPTRWVRAAKLRSAGITLTGRNLWIDSDFSYRDPEGSLSGAANGQGFYHGVTPGTKSYSLSVSLGI